ncbi:Hypothetical predicted protein [Cloeon dipterum]|uniref:DDB1- and CUL4-associated factor 15 WD40 repeat-containing domain-containing protein n=1 Tax=Cloeon dipterum TaxID=197152 RepID=A0A8S1BRY3_9INSE|nr:Hypothetical predicted protein [Cloeon dipterum]
MGQHAAMRCQQKHNNIENEKMADENECDKEAAENILIFESKPRATAQRPKPNLLHCLANRQIYGSHVANYRASVSSVNSKPLPDSYFLFQLEDIFPASALLKGHIVLGFSRCGQFLLTYTINSYESSGINFTYNYTLHWWACIPRCMARRVAEVTLFKNQGVEENLYISLCQWPNDNSKMLIYGTTDPANTTTTQTKPFYVTVTMVPSLHNCQDCQKVAATFDVEDLAANWDSCVRFSCLRHGATVHSTCDIVAPYPTFEPTICMKLDGTAVINTGNFLHVLKVELENSRVLRDESDECVACGLLASSQDDLEVKQSPLMLKSPPYAASSEEGDETESWRRRHLESESEDSHLSSDHNSLCQQNSDETIFNKPQAAQRSKQQLEEAEKAYEFIEENPPEIKLSVYRMRRLADKKYEFCADEEESENITPYRQAKLDSPSKTDCRNRNLPQQATMQELYIYTSPPFSPADSDDSSKVLRPLNSNLPYFDNKNSPKSFVMAELASPGNNRSRKEASCGPAIERKPFKYLVKLQRRYFEVDDEMISVITDVEDDDMSGLTGYHSALPLEVHGSGYTQMQMVSNSKAEKLKFSCVLVRQISFDIEQFCHEVAQVLCADAGMQYWFCSDYDVEIVDMCPNSGDLLVIAFILLQASKKSATKNARQASLSRRTYQASFLFSWNIETGRYSVTRTSTLKEADSLVGTQWHPARMERDLMRASFPPIMTHPKIRELTNLSVLQGESLPALLDTENHIAIRLHD